MNVLSEFLYFFSFSDTNINNVLIGTSLLGITAGIVGSLVVLSRKTLIIDAISHSMLPGICIGFLLSGIKNPVFLLLGGISTATLSVWLIGQIKSRTKIKTDGAIAISLSLLFSLGVIMLNIVQNTGNPNQSGLNDFLFGKAASMVQSDLYYFVTLCIISLIVIPIFFRHFKISLFDSVFAQSIGINKFWIQTIISFLTIITAAAGIQTVGIILMSAMVIAPAAGALFWTKDFKTTILISGSIGLTCSVLGVFISYLSPEMPTGPWVVVCLSTVAIFSALFSPKGLIVKQLQLKGNRTRILRENLLKRIYKLIEKKRTSSINLNDLSEFNATSKTSVYFALNKLKSNGLIIKSGVLWSLTEKGKQEAERIIRIHRLWELYLQKYMQLPSNYVHNSAESLEHIITPEIERNLEKVMGKPTHDPHHQKIPYQD